MLKEDLRGNTCVKQELRLAFKMLGSINYKDYVYNGEKPFLSIADEDQENSYGVIKLK